MNFTGRWVTDSSHQHNEIHDIASAQLIECNDCRDDDRDSSRAASSPPSESAGTRQGATRDASCRTPSAPVAIGPQGSQQEGGDRDGDGHRPRSSRT